MDDGEDEELETAVTDEPIRQRPLPAGKDRTQPANGAARQPTMFAKDGVKANGDTAGHHQPL